MARTCSICRHPEREAIEKALLAGEPFRKLAKRSGTSATSLHHHKHTHLAPALAHAATERQAEVNRLLDFDLTQRESRLAALQDRSNRMRRVVEARSKDMADAPGGETGLLVRRQKMIGSGERAKVVEEFEVDTGLLKEARAHEEQAARELGQYNPEHGSQSGPRVAIIVLPTVMPESMRGVEKIVLDWDDRRRSLLPAPPAPDPEGG